MQISKIVFPVEFSAACSQAAVHVAAWARRFNADVTLLHVEEPPALGLEAMGWQPPTRAASEALSKYMVSEFEGVKAERVLRAGDAAAEITQYAQGWGADVIMMPTHGHGAFRRFLIGSVAAKVLHDAPCAVWTSAHLQDFGAAEVRFDNFLCAVDLDDRGVETLRAAGKLVATTGARLTIAHVVPGSESGPDVYMEHDLRNSVIEAARERLALMQKQAGTAAEVRVSSGSIARCIASTAREQRSDLVIIGRGGHGVFGRLRTHDYGIIRECGSPVLSL